MYFLQADKKGLVSQTGKEKWVEFARKMQANYPLSVWAGTITFYLDGVSFLFFSSSFIPAVFTIKYIQLCNDNLHSETHIDHTFITDIKMII